MALPTLQDLPNIYKSEWAHYDLLIKTYPLTTSGVYSFVSPSSGIPYSTTTGGQYAVLLQLQTALSDYLLKASQWNSIQTEINPFRTIFTTTGTSPTYVLTIPSTSYFSLTSGQPVIVKFHSASAVASTLNVNGTGAVPLKKPNGNNFTSISANGVYTFLYDSGNFILQGEGGDYGTVTAPRVLTPYTFGTESGLATGTMPNRSGTTNAISSTIGGTSLYLLPSEGYRDGVDDYVGITDADFVASNILNGVNIFGLTGSAIKKDFYSVNNPSVTGNNTIPVGGLTTTFSITLSGFNFTPRTAIVEMDSTSYFSATTLAHIGSAILSQDYPFTSARSFASASISSNSYYSLHQINAIGSGTFFSNGSATISITYTKSHTSPASTSICNVTKVVLLP